MEAREEVRDRDSMVLARGRYDTDPEEPQHSNQRVAIGVEETAAAA